MVLTFCSPAWFLFRALADILRQQGPVPISQYEHEDLGVMDGSPKDETPIRTSKNHYTPVHGMVSNHGRCRSERGGHRPQLSKCDFIILPGWRAFFFNLPVHPSTEIDGRSGNLKPFPSIFLKMEHIREHIGDARPGLRAGLP